MTDWTTCRVTPEMQAELRQLLDATETPWALWDGYGPDGNGDMRVARIGHLSGSGIRADPDSADIYGRREAFELLASAVNALPALLDAAAERDRLARLLDEPRRSGCAVEIAGVRIAPCDERGQTADMLAADRLRRELAYMAEARDNARAEVERLSAQLDAVRALHGPRVVQVLGPVCSAEECDHEDACPLVDYTVCGHCYDVGDGAHPYAYEEGGLQDVAHPCATYRAIDATPETGCES